MRCRKCGHPLDDDARFCTNCGTKVDRSEDFYEKDLVEEKQSDTEILDKDEIKQNEDNFFYEDQEIIEDGENLDYVEEETFDKEVEDSTKAKGSNKGLRNIIIILLVLLLGIFSYKYVKSRPQKIDVSYYYDIELEGVDGFAKANLVFDKDKFLADNKGKIENRSSSNKDEPYDEYLAEIIENMAPAELDKYENIANGDDLTVTYTIPEDQKLDVEEKYKVEFVDPQSETVSIEGLDEVGEFDPFDYVDVSVEGIYPNNYLNIKVKDDAPEEMNFVNISADKESKIQKGDTIKLVAEANNDTLSQNYGKKVSTTEKDITIDDVPSFLADVSNLPEEDLASLKDAAKEKLAEMSLPNGVSLNDAKYVGEVLSYKENSGNELYLLYEITVAEDIKGHKGKFTFYNAVDFSDVTIGSDNLYSYMDMLYQNASHKFTKEGSTKRESLPYNAFYSVDEILKEIKTDKDKTYTEKFDPDISAYRVRTDGIANEYLSNENSILTLYENGSARYQQEFNEIFTGTWTNDGDNFYLNLDAFNKNKDLKGKVDVGKSINIPDQNQWKGEVFKIVK